MAATVLPVDDSASIRQMVGMTLKRAGSSVVEASDGQEGLDKAKTGTFQLVLTDQNMPRMDGPTLVRALRGLPAYKSVPILMLHRVGRRHEGARPRGRRHRLADQTI